MSHKRRTAAAALLIFVLALAPSLVVGTARLRIPVAFLIHGLAGIGVVAAARNFPVPARVVESDGRGDGRPA